MGDETKTTSLSKETLEAGIRVLHEYKNVLSQDALVEKIFKAMHLTESSRTKVNAFGEHICGVFDSTKTVEPRRPYVAETRDQTIDRIGKAIWNSYIEVGHCGTIEPITEAGKGYLRRQAQTALDYKDPDF